MLRLKVVHVLILFRLRYASILKFRPIMAAKTYLGISIFIEIKEGKRANIPEAVHMYRKVLEKANDCG